MSMKMSRKVAALLAGLAVAGVTGFAPAVHAASPPKETISEDAAAAVAKMGKTLSADNFSFVARTLRTYAGPGGVPLHIGHSMKITVHRPDRMLIEVTGDDGSAKMIYDGKTLVVYGVDANKYFTIPVPNTIEGMLEKVTKQLGIDFPLADLLSASPDKSFMYGITSGHAVGLATIDGMPTVHLLFNQPPGIELELWLDKNDKALPRRLYVTYHDIPTQPTFIAEFSDWNFDVKPTDADFTFQPPAGATQVDMKPGATKAPTKP